MLATWHPCQSMQSAAETTSQEEYEALVCVSKLQVITKTIRLCNQLVFYGLRLKMMYQCKVMNLCFPPFQVFGSHFC